MVPAPKAALLDLDYRMLEDKLAGAAGYPQRGDEDGRLGRSERAPVPKADGQAAGSGGCKVAPPAPPMPPLQVHPSPQHRRQETGQKRRRECTEPVQKQQEKVLEGRRKCTASLRHDDQRHHAVALPLATSQPGGALTPPLYLPVRPSFRSLADPVTPTSLAAPAASDSSGDAAAAPEGVGLLAAKAGGRPALALSAQGGSDGAGRAADDRGGEISDADRRHPCHARRLPALQLHGSIDGRSGEVEAPSAQCSVVQQQQPRLLGVRQLLRNTSSVGSSACIHLTTPSMPTASCGPAACLPWSSPRRLECVWGTAPRLMEAVLEEPATPVFSACAHGPNVMSHTDHPVGPAPTHPGTPIEPSYTALGQHGKRWARQAPKCGTEGCGEHAVRALTPGDHLDTETLTVRAPVANSADPEVETALTRTLSAVQADQAVAGTPDTDTETETVTEPEPDVEADVDARAQCALKSVAAVGSGYGPLPTPFARIAALPGTKVYRTGVKAQAAAATAPAPSVTCDSHTCVRRGVSPIAAVADSASRGFAGAVGNEGAAPWPAPGSAAAAATSAAAPKAAVVVAANAATTTADTAIASSGSLSVLAAAARDTQAAGPHPCAATVLMLQSRHATGARLERSTVSQEQPPPPQLQLHQPQQGQQPLPGMGSAPAAAAAEPPSPLQRSPPELCPLWPDPKKPRPERLGSSEPQQVPESQAELGSQPLPSAQQSPPPARGVQPWPQRGPAPPDGPSSLPITSGLHLPQLMQPIPPPVYVTVGAFVSRRRKHRQPSLSPLDGVKKRQPTAVLAALPATSVSPTTAAADPNVALAEQPLSRSYEHGSGAGDARGGTSSLAEAESGAAVARSGASQQQEAGRAAANPHCTGGAAAAAAFGASGAAAGAAGGAGVGVLAAAALLRQRRTVTLGGFVLAVPANMVCEVLGLFHPERYLDGWDCVEFPPGSGEFISRSHFEKVGGAVTAKWYRSIRVIPQLENLRDWLTRHNLPVFKGSCRKRVAKVPAASRASPDAGLAGCGAPGPEANTAEVTPSAATAPAISLGGRSTSGQNGPGLAVATEVRSLKTPATKDLLSPTPVAAGNLRSQIAATPSALMAVPPRLEPPLQDEASYDSASAMAEAEDAADEPEFATGSAAAADADAGAKAEAEAFAATGPGDEPAAVKGTRIPGYAQLPPWQWREDKELSFPRSYGLLHLGPSGLASGTAMGPRPRTMRAPPVSAWSRARPQLDSAMGASITVLNAAKLSAPPPLALPSYHHPHYRGQASPWSMRLAWQPRQPQQPRDLHPVAAIEEHGATSGPSCDAVGPYANAVEPYGDDVGPYGTNAGCGAGADATSEQPLPVVGGQLHRVPARQHGLQLTGSGWAGADPRALGGNAWVHGLHTSSLPSPLMSVPPSGPGAGSRAKQAPYGSHPMAVGRRTAEPQELTDASHQPGTPQLDAPCRSPSYGGPSPLGLYGTPQPPLAARRAGGLVGVPLYKAPYVGQQPLDRPAEDWTPSQPPAQFVCQSPMGPDAGPADLGMAPAGPQRAQAASQGPPNSGRSKGAYAASGSSAGADGAVLPCGPSAMPYPSPYVPYYYPRLISGAGGGWQPLSVYSPSQRQMYDAVPYAAASGARASAVMQQSHGSSIRAAARPYGIADPYHESRQPAGLGPRGPGSVHKASLSAAWPGTYDDDDDEVTNRNEREQAAAQEDSDVSYIPQPLSRPFNTQSYQPRVHFPTAPRPAAAYSHLQEHTHHPHHPQPQPPYKRPTPLLPHQVLFPPHRPPAPKRGQLPPYPPLHLCYQPSSPPSQQQPQQSTTALSYPGGLPPHPILVRQRRLNAGLELVPWSADGGVAQEGVEPVVAEVAGLERQPVSRKRKATGGKEDE